MDPVHGPGPYFDGPGPWTRSTKGVHGPGVHVCTFPSKMAITNTELFCSLSFIFEIRNISRLQT